ncbi:MAG: hypothetical protein ACI37Z_10040 [Candidatus Gastranaerophilaceae bacterium]
MENFIKKIKNHNLLEIFLITLIIVLCNLFWGTESFQIFSDRGREFVLAQGILEGFVPFKDILFLYSPLAYYINAIFLFVFGSSINALMIASTLCSSIFAIFYFLLTKEFINKNLSFLITLLVVFGCISSCTIFKYLLPYSFSMVYGVSASVIAIFCLVKYLKNNIFKFAYLAEFFAGFAFALKLEFLPFLLISYVFIITDENFQIKDKIKLILTSTSIPIITFMLPIIQGVTINDYTNYIKFFSQFSNTEGMQSYYISMGSVLSFSNIQSYISGFIGILLIFILTYITFKMYKKFRNKLILVIMGIVTFGIIFAASSIYSHTILLPIVILVLYAIKFKEINSDRAELLIILSSLALSIRCFFMMKMSLHGVYSLPLIIIALYILTNKFNSLKITKEEQNTIYYFTISIYLAFFISMNFVSATTCNTPISSSKGSILLPKDQAEIINSTIKYIGNNTQKTDKILVLPEGQIINFMTDRKCDLKLHMLDRLYYEGLGEENALSLLQNSNNDYIIIAKGFNLSTFGKHFLYEEQNEITKYITQNYSQIKYFGNNNHKIFILKKI